LLARPSQPAGQSIGLVAAYGFNEGAGSTVADLSGNSITGTIVGATWVTGRYGSALSFNGNSSYVDLGNPAALQLTSSMTIEAWVKAAANPADDGQIVAKSNGTGWQLKTTPDTGPHTFGLTLSPTSSTTTQRYSTTARSLATWYHIAGVYDAVARTMSTYVNGAIDNGTLSGAVPASQFNQTVNVNIGRRTGGFYFNGVIDEVRIYSRALSQSDVQADMNTPVGGTPPPPDNIPPVVSMAGPADGATVSGTISVTAAASDNVGVAGVQFYLDSVALGSEVVAAPFTYQWNTSTTPIGSHTLSAIARDYSGNTAGSQVISITVTNPTASLTGQWSAVASWPIVAVHAMLLPTGNVLAWTDYTDNAGAQLWRPSTNTFVAKTFSLVSLFCSAHTFLSDGRVLIAGGIVGLQDDLGPHETTIFDPATETWSQAGLMSAGRYYPTTTTLGDGRIMVQGGTTTCTSCVADTPEIYDPVTNTWTPMAASANKSFQYYPHIYQLPDGRILAAAQDDRAIATQVLDLPTQTWSTVDSRLIDGHSSAMYLPGKIIKAGTATADNPGHPSAATTYVLDMTQASPPPTWQATAPMAFHRSFLNLTVLPDGQVLATGGGTTTDPADFSKAVYEAELWSPTSMTWTTMARAQIPRLYHSTALLLPDARVLVAGGGRQNGRSQPDPKDEPNAEIFSPPYLFKGPRPVITTAPSVLQYNSPFNVATPDASRIASVSLIALSAVTHAYNESQRFVPLTFTPAGGSLTVNGPVNGNTAPPGPYMLFVVDTAGVPSVAAMVRLPAPYEDLQAPTAPTNLTASSGTGAIGLAWSAATDNVGVTAYNVHRSATSGFAPTVANRIGQTSVLTYTDSVFSSPGTYYYLVTAQDAKGNVSGPSDPASGTVLPDTTPPTVTIIAPSNGTTVSGLRTVSASASDDVAVAGVQFLLDGSPLGAEVPGPGATFNVSWTTSTVPNGAHTLSARARDGGGNTSVSGPISVTVANTTPSGLVAAYAFNETGGTTVTDYSGNNLTGTIVGATRAAGKYGNALSFNGTTNYVDLGNPAALQLTGSMTIEAWVKAAANPADDGQIVAKSNGTGWQLKTSKDTGAQTFGIAVSINSTSTSQRYSTTVRSLGTWYHVAGVYNAATSTLSTYVNGVLDNGTLRGVVPATQVNSSVNVNIGRRTGGFYFNGIIDEVRIYNRALTPAEIQSDLNTPINPPAPTVASVSPASGSTSGGTTVTIGGTGFVTGAVVTVGGVPATGVTIANASSMTATTPAHAAGAVTVTVTNPDSQAGSLPTGFTYVAPALAPTIGSVAPGTGPTTGGTAITISGANFVSGATVSIGGTPATGVNVLSSTSIRATTAAHAPGTVTVSVTNPDSQSGALTSAFAYISPPAVTGVSPASGPTAGGTAITITGSGFITGATATVGGMAATGVSVLSSTSISATTPPHAAGPVIVTVTNPDLQSAGITNAFSYLAPAPTVVNVSPDSGPAAGGTLITIAGNDFASGATVSVGGTPATTVNVLNSTSIRATTSAHAAGAVTVVVTNPDAQSGVSNSAFTYVSPPFVTSVSPASGAIAGGTAITIIGSNFTNGAAVTIDGVAATAVSVVSGTSISATTPPHAAGAVVVAVTNPDTQSGNLANAFTYVAPAPAILSVSPGSAPATGGSVVTITGDNFAAGASVSIGGAAATGVSVTNATTIVATTPAHAAGAVTVSVTNPDTQAGLLDSGFTYVAAPNVTGISPGAGPTAGGTVLLISGANFANGATVTVGGAAATGVSVVSGTSITATTPGHAAGPTAVTVTNPDAQTGSLPSSFVYLPPPTVNSVSPNAGTTNGGTTITIAGTNFLSGATVAVGGVSATGVSVNSTSSITATAPAHLEGATTVTVTNPDAQSGSLADAFTYSVPLPAPLVTAVSPESGATLGGTTVMITGANFVTGATVTMGGTLATGVTVVSASEIAATSPVHPAGLVAVAVTNPDTQVGSRADAFTYTPAPAPTIAGISPGSGPIAGGTMVTIAGTNFVSGAIVTIGDTPATDIIITGTSIAAMTPAHAAGVVAVSVTNPDAQADILADAFTYVGPPTVASVSPASGPTAGGTTVTIDGMNFANGATVTIGGVPATGITVVNPTTITAIAPAHAAGASTVVITNPDTQSGAGVNGFTYIAPAPVIASVTPGSGPTTGGTVLNIGGSAFVSGAAVTVGGVAATGVSVIGATSITATAPAHPAGTVTVAVTNPDAQSASLVNSFTYVGPPVITSVSPASGLTNGGTSVTIGGSNFVSGATVTVGGIAATDVTMLSATAISATTPAHGAGASTVIVTNPDGQSGASANGFTYVAPAPSVLGVAPTSGPTAGGTVLTISGSAFASGASVTIGGIPATGVTVPSATSITATAPAHGAGTVGVTVTNPDAQSGSLASGFTYVGPPTVASVSPASGPTAGGTTVTIAGLNFVSGATVTIGSVPATDITVVNATTITVLTPAHAAGISAVVVTNPDGQSGTRPNGFTYVAPAPLVSSVAPASGPTTGGTALTITGSAFGSGATVTVGGAPATGVTIVSATSITATAPAHAAGTVGVTVTNPDAQSGSLASGFTYVGPPTVASVSPASGPTAGGTTVTIAGTSFVNGAAVTIGGAPATGITVINATTIAAVTPPHATGAATVVVTNPDAQSGSKANGFTYVAPAPSVSSVAPSTGPTTGGTVLTITGAAFVSGAGVTVGGTPATSVSVVNATSITATAPAHSAGVVAVTVTNPDAQSGSLANGFTFVAPAPAVVGVSPSVGPTTGGTSVTVTGSGFVNGAIVTVGGSAATNVTVVSATSITMKTPAHATGAVAVVVTNPDAQTGSLGNAFTFSAAPPPAVLAIAPNAGTTAGGAVVTISGANFVAGATVTVGGVAATGIIVTNSTSMTAITPAHAAGAATVTVTNPDLQSAGLTNAFTYVAPQTISFVRASAATPAATAAAVTVAYSGAQTAGDLNVIVIGWNTPSATVQSVRDSLGNAYNLAIGPTVGTGRAQAIYYAPNITAGNNSVTVTFTTTVSTIDVRVLEYRGVSTLDIARGASGSGGSANSGAGTTTTANELIVGADTVATLTTGAGSGFTSRIITSPNGDIAEDRIVKATGSYSATASLNGSGAWVMQMVTFK